MTPWRSLSHRPAVLCAASYWIAPRDAKHATKIYQAYLQHGAHFGWASRFGSSACPVPDFQAAQRAQDLANARTMARALKRQILRGLASAI